MQDEDVKIHKCSPQTFSVHICNTLSWTGAPLTFTGDGRFGTTQFSQARFSRREVGESGARVIEALFDDNDFNGPGAVVVGDSIRCTVAPDDLRKAMKAVAEKLEIKLPTPA